jgi:hypothetical protein
MTALAATDLTVSIPTADRDIVPAGPKKVSVAKITFGDGALTYPTGGIPLPTIGNFGFHKEMRAIPAGVSGKGNLFEFDKTNHKLRGFVGNATTDGMVEMSGAVAAQSVDLLLIGE